jgi:hypothetical protein
VGWAISSVSYTIAAHASEVCMLDMGVGHVYRRGMTALNGGKPYDVDGAYLMPAPDDLGLPFPAPSENDTAIIRDMTGQYHFRFIGGRWVEEGFVPAERI